MTTPKKNPETNHERKLTRSNTWKTWGKKLKNVKKVCVVALGVTLGTAAIQGCGPKDSDMTKTSKELTIAIKNVEKQQKEVTEAEEKVKDLEEDLIEARKEIIEEKKDVIEAQKEVEKMKKEVQDESKKL